MIQRHSALRSVALVWGISLLFFNLVGCGGGGSSTALPPGINSDSEQQQTLNPQPPERNVLSTSMPALGSLSAGAEFDFTINGEFVSPLFQGSARVLYDPATVQLLSAARGALIPSGGVFLCRADMQPGALQSPDARMSGVIPFAFTGQPGEPGIAPGRGELLRLRFRLLARPSGGACIRLLNDPAFLQLRDAQGQRLSFDLSSAEVSQ